MPRVRNPNGFTTLEMLLAMAVLGLILAIAAALLQTNQRVSDAQQARTNSLEDARMAASRMAETINQAAYIYPAGKQITSGIGLGSVNGVTTFQKGFPLNLTVTPNNTNSQGGGSRPNVVAGCEKSRDGAIQSRLTQYFNTSCFVIPPSFAFGNESRTDPNLRGPGIANYDFALAKKTAITERYNLEFRGEVFNVFNRVQFGMPNRVATPAANATFGQITTTANDPRLIQLALRLKF